MKEMTEQERLILDLTAALKERITANEQFNINAQVLVERGYAAVKSKMPTLAELQAMWRASDPCACGHRRDAHVDRMGTCSETINDIGDVEPCGCLRFITPREQCCAENWDGEYCILDRGHDGEHKAVSADTATSSLSPDPVSRENAE